MDVTDNVILNHNEINHKIRRIAFQIYESNVDEKEVILAGIASNGYIFAKKLKAVLQKISDLNTLGEVFYELYQHWIKARELFKKNRGLLEFNDLTMACYQLFHGEHGLGVTWLLQQSIRHLLLDEFQDTSLLQWSVFEKLSNEH